MKFVETALKGAFIIEPEPLQDERGFFARTFCEREFSAYGLAVQFVQCSISFNERRNTLRGMHYQTVPDAEFKLARCTRGAIYDVIIDLRSDSPTFCKWVAVELSADNRRALYVPQGFAHGFQTLTDAAEVFYQISEYYAPLSTQGVRWNDPAFGIEWPPAAERIISQRDRSYPDFHP